MLIISLQPLQGVGLLVRNLATAWQQTGSRRQSDINTDAISARGRHCGRRRRLLISCCTAIAGVDDSCTGTSLPP
jgi:hypothetical protein